MKDFFKYITASEEDKDWGLYMNVAGKSTIPTGIAYPSPEHPSGYYFNCGPLVSQLRAGGVDAQVA